MIIPIDARREQMELRDRLGLPAFLDHIWLERLQATPEAHKAEKATGVWPLKQGAQMASPPLTQPHKLRMVRRHELD